MANAQGFLPGSSSERRNLTAETLSEEAGNSNESIRMPTTFIQEATSNTTFPARLKIAYNWLHEKWNAERWAALRFVGDEPADAVLRAGLGGTKTIGQSLEPLAEVEKAARSFEAEERQLTLSAKRLLSDFALCRLGLTSEVFVERRPFLRGTCHSPPSVYCTSAS